MKTLVELMPPPEHPVEATGDWDVVETELRLRLPQDYKDYVRIYGRGHIGDFLGVYTPFSTAKYPNLLYQAKTHADLQRDLKEQFGDLMPYDFYPEQGGLLPVMQTDNGDLVYWLTAKDPDAWELVVNETRSFNYQKLQCSLTDFVSGVFTGRIECEAFPQLDVTVPISFRPAPVPNPVGVELFVPGSR